MTTAGSGRPLEDPVSNVLKWVLLAVAEGSFALFAWATVLTYERAAPQPDRFVAAGGATLISHPGRRLLRAGSRHPGRTSRSIPPIRNRPADLEPICPRPRS